VVAHHVLHSSRDALGHIVLAVAPFDDPARAALVVPLSPPLLPSPTRHAARHADSAHARPMPVQTDLAIRALIAADATRIAVGVD
jgi:hypothetical protein